MRAWRYDHLDGLDGLRMHEEATPAPERGEVLLRVDAVSLNYRDVAMPLGRYPAPHEAGHIPSSDAAATVVACGAAVRGLAVGDRVAGIFHRRWLGGRPPIGWERDGYGAVEDGWLAEYKAVAAESLVALPHAIGAEAGATLPCAATAAWTAIGGGRRPVQPGETVLTLGTGGVSVFAVQLAHALGARVIATTSSAAKADRLRALGADEVVNYADVGDWGAAVRAMTGGRGADVVVENGGAGTLEQSLRAVAEGGTVALVGFLSGAAPGVDWGLLFGANACVRPIRVGSRDDTADVVRMVAATGLVPVIDQVFGFEEAPAAFRHLASGRHFGKVVIRLGA